jgi:hypothetical protein
MYLNFPSESEGYVKFHEGMCQPKQFRNLWSSSITEMRKRLRPLSSCDIVCMKFHTDVGTLFCVNFFSILRSMKWKWRVRCCEGDRLSGGGLEPNYSVQLILDAIVNWCDSVPSQWSHVVNYTVSLSGISCCFPTCRNLTWPFCENWHTFQTIIFAITLLKQMFQVVLFLVFSLPAKRVDLQLTFLDHMREDSTFREHTSWVYSPLVWRRNKTTWKTVYLGVT